ncbi:MAG TPA: hypothetical protein VJK03_00900 [Candidatus Nanoarchaeia archaeon]|nr:hypothetical protein [Candidatus Nanoarchaeia archaeon]
MTAQIQLVEVKSLDDIRNMQRGDTFMLQHEPWDFDSRQTPARVNRPAYRAESPSREYNFLDVVYRFNSNRIMRGRILLEASRVNDGSLKAHFTSYECVERSETDFQELDSFLREVEE